MSVLGRATARAAEQLGLFKGARWYLREAPRTGAAKAETVLVGVPKTGPRPPVGEVRLLAPDDWAIQRSFSLRLHDYPLDFNVTRAKVLSTTEAEIRDGLQKMPTFVGTRDGAPVARVRLAPDEPGVLELKGVLVLPEARGTGISDLTVRTALEWARDQGHGKVRLWVRENNKPAIDLYTRTGFRPTGETRPLAPDPSLNSVEMMVRVGR
ncbi:GNAT family N-acetyltransferase [Actinoallomurus sp. CA-142502]|uniref:GNAT family N-acetyltransferase n=1 Tax=Actinoallomurus sp. CA-142502 TaxID=3239885 RepID=UPI003D92A989